jgi:hypothetical protein
VQTARLPSNSSLSKGCEQNLVISPPDISKVPKGLSNGDLLIGYFSCRAPKTDMEESPIPDNVAKLGLQLPIGAVPISYVVSHIKEKNKEGGSSYSFDGAKSVEENFNEAKKKNAVDYIEFLLKKGHLNNVEALLPKFLQEFPNHLPLLKQRIDLQLRLVKDKSVAEFQAVAAACDALLANIDTQAMALFFGVKHDDESDKPALQLHNDKKDTLLFALNAKGIALADIFKLEPSEDIKKSIKATISEISHWVKLSEEPKYLGLYVTVERLEGNLSGPLKALKKVLTTANEKPLRELEIELCRELRWDHWVAQRSAKLLTDFPSNFRLF